jgi:formylmethanofuran dehydrogenase subunit E
VTEEPEQLKTQIKDAVELHGHLGPFLVIGVRMGKVALQILKSGNQQDGELHAWVEVPLRTPFSCTLDGIQSTTHCTIGNQRLRVENSLRKISARFETRDSGKTLTITVNPEIVKEVTDEISKGTPNEAQAEVIASKPERQLFTLSINKKHL